MSKREFDMTWWETKEMATYIADIEAALDEWSMSNSEMRIEQNNIERVAKKIDQTRTQTTSEDKKVFLTNLADRVEGLRQHLTERLKRGPSKVKTAP